ncbi:hypothetical protein BC834DRAFT_632605 [Gloeopeniophorella convolvens]|nr:hypothetical protein BC834DRAFT_632605 [Gloeopeniophorella convolvens]
MCSLAIEGDLSDVATSRSLSSPFRSTFLLNTLSATFLGTLTSSGNSVSQPLKGFGKRVNIVTFIAIVTMYIVSLIHFAATTYPNLPSGAILTRSTSYCQILICLRQTSLGEWLQYAKGSAALINVTLSDLIVMWRAWLLWDRSRRVLAPLAILFLATQRDSCRHLEYKNHLGDLSTICTFHCLLNR